MNDFQILKYVRFCTRHTDHLTYYRNCRDHRSHEKMMWINIRFQQDTKTGLPYHYYTIETKQLINHLLIFLKIYRNTIRLMVIKTFNQFLKKFFFLFLEKRIFFLRLIFDLQRLHREIYQNYRRRLMCVFKECFLIIYMFRHAGSGVNSDTHKW